MKKLFYTLTCLCVLVALCIISASAAWSWNIDENGTLYITGTGAMKDFLNQSDRGSPWGGYNEYICSKVKSIYIEEGITHIGDYAFFRCKNAENISIPNSVTSIGKFAFWDCSGIEEIILPEGLTTINSGTFMGCDSLKNIKIPKNVSNIDYYAFGYTPNIQAFVVDPENQYYSSIDGCLFSKDASKLIKYTTGLPREEYTIPNTVKEIGKCAFTDSQHLQTIIFPESITEITYIFYGGEFKELKTLIIPKSVTKINDSLSECSGLTIYYEGTEAEWANIASGFYYNDDTNVYCSDKTICWSVNGSVLTFTGTGNMKDYSTEESPYISSRNEIVTINIGENITSVGAEAFRNFINLKNVTLPTTLTYIGEGAFRGCEMLKQISIPNNVTRIEKNAFRSCEDLICITIPSNVTFIGDNAFYQCSDLTIYGVSGSYAQTYAQENSIPFICIHNLGEWNIVTDATCTTAGLKTRSCACGESESETVPALGHDIISHEAQSPTCTQSGYEAYETCSRCGYTTHMGDIPALGHSTVTQLKHTCTICGHTEYEENPMLGIIQGDMNSDGELTLIDILILLKLVLNQ